MWTGIPSSRRAKLKVSRSRPGSTPAGATKTWASIGESWARSKRPAASGASGLWRQGSGTWQAFVGNGTNATFVPAARRAGHRPIIWSRPTRRTCGRQGELKLYVNGSADLDARDLCSDDRRWGAGHPLPALHRVRRVAPARAEDTVRRQDAVRRALPGRILRCRRAKAPQRWKRRSSGARPMSRGGSSIGGGRCGLRRCRPPARRCSET